MNSIIRFDSDKRIESPFCKIQRENFIIQLLNPLNHRCLAISDLIDFRESPILFDFFHNSFAVC
ncbi:hypothetical protein LEP1GSC038_3923 [Leptospira weilii str. 2006001855]|uniref:Uncharacterized protein n=1 Tax=Leptospira weilii str. 2006001855 TaxID=996804 RepID=M6FPT5_9LEPT|nr:hypothetical protein LEP1GSC038_3923 [Leptospira weilii str. 2006001855]